MSEPVALLPLFSEIQRATLAARARLGDSRIGTRVRAGQMQMVSVEYPRGKRGASVVTPLSEWMPLADVVRALDALAGVTPPAVPVSLFIGRKQSTHATLLDAVRHHNAARDASGKGYHAWPSCKVVIPGRAIYHVSYNGRVWDRSVSENDAVEIIEHLADAR